MSIRPPASDWSSISLQWLQFLFSGNDIGFSFRLTAGVSRPFLLLDPTHSFSHPVTRKISDLTFSPAYKYKSSLRLHTKISYDPYIVIPSKFVLFHPGFDPHTYKVTTTTAQFTFYKVCKFNLTTAEIVISYTF